MNNKNLHRKLNQALKDLEDRGYFTAKNFWCCNTCGWGAIADTQKDKAVFYHSQDATALRENGTLYLSWSGSGDEVVETLKSRGLFSHWNGQDNSRIFVAESKPDNLPNKIQDEIRDDLLRAKLDELKSSITGLSREKSHLLDKLIEEAKKESIQFGINEYSESDFEAFKQNKIEEYIAKLDLKDKEYQETFVKLITLSILNGLQIGLKNKLDSLLEY